MVGRHVTATSTSTRGTSAAAFWLPPLTHVRQALHRLTIPAAALDQNFTGRLLGLALVGAVAQSPPHVLYADIVRAARVAGWPDDWVRAVISVGARCGALVGPYDAGGQDMVRVGPAYDADAAEVQSLVSQIMRVLDSDMAIN